MPKRANNYLQPCLLSNNGKSSDTKNHLVYTLDTDSDTCSLFEELLYTEGFQVRGFQMISELRAAMDRRPAEILVMNFEVYAVDTTSLISEFRTLAPEMSVFMVSETADVKRAVSAMRLGATDVLVKPLLAEPIMESLRAAMRHPRRHSHPQAHANEIRAAVEYGLDALTSREQQILHLVLNGDSNKEIARELDISPRTVEVHRAHAMVKLGARNTADLIRIVLTAA